MTDKKFKGAPFGVQTSRFDVSGVHPKSKTPGTFTQIPYDKKSICELNRRLGPGSYHVDTGDFSDKAVIHRASGPGWARAYEVSKMAALPHLLHKEQWELKKLLERKLGPGTYNIKDFLTDQRPHSIRGICQTKEQRFKEPSTLNDTPGPGTYGKGGVPHAALEEKGFKSTSTVGMLDAGSSQPRSLPMVGSDLGPGSYNFESFTDQTAKKLTSLRGPYDLFTGERNKPITTGHYASPISHLGPGQYELKSFLDDMTSEHSKKQGKFGKVEQYPAKHSDRIYCCTLPQVPRNPEDPGPGNYDPDNPNLKKPSFAKKSPGFLSSAQRNDRIAQKFFTRNFNPVGAGRYDIQKWEESHHINAHKSVFDSKTGRYQPSMEKFYKERIRAKDLRPEDKICIIQPETPSQYVQRQKDNTPMSNQRATTVV
ncbi:ciliary microtubule-associated protein 2-like [Tubulanus polymorphus]|uniref:ciliary microtubule-associated protein 2-like n=1 Tax=Tubulanus polymorphus TaxID=672921 RepID=UPI003DA507FC